MQRGRRMEEASDFTMGLLMGLLGLFVASRAHDVEMYVFGLGLAAMAVLFVFGLVRRHFDDVEAARGRDGTR